MAVVLALAATLLAPAPGRGAPVRENSPVASGKLVPAVGPYFGPILDWTVDGAQAYSTRLGSVPAVFGQAVRYPLSRADDTYLAQFVAQVAGQGALALLDLEPVAPLRRLTAAQATHLAGQLAALNRRYGTEFYVRFAREMNGSWTTWGQQPTAFVSAFRTVADAVHRALPRSQAAMVWAPSYGAGYPFAHAYGRVPKSGPVSRSQLDTNGDGQVSDADDAYAPYYPGDRYVDWVGLSVYDYGVGRTFGANVVPAPNRYTDELRGRYGYSAPRGQGRAFVADYATAHGKPMMVETAALYDGHRPGGASELSIKRSWWREVLSRQVARRFPEIRMIAWLERLRPEAEVHNLPIDWRVTHTPTLAGALRQDLRRDGIPAGPVLPVRGPDAGGTTGSSSAGPSASPRTGGTTGHGAGLAWIAVGTVVVLAVGTACGVAVRRRRSARRL